MHRAILVAAIFLAGCVAAPVQPMPPRGPEVEALLHPPLDGLRCNIDVVGVPTALLHRYYPEPALSQGVQGWAVARISLDASGALTGVSILATAPGETFAYAAAQIFTKMIYPPQPRACSVVRAIQFRIAE